MPRKTPDLTTQRFGRLVVLARNREVSATHAMWYCSCDCGKTATVASASLRSGNTRSCGCLRRETTITRSTTHGLTPRGSKSGTYNSWASMIRRTTHENDPRYQNWGGRGIKVCGRWLKYPNFLADMGERPSGTTLERIDNDGNYEKDNCIWAPSVVQARNKRSARLTPAVILRIRDLAKAGGGVQEIAAATGVDRHSVGTVMATIDALSWEDDDHIARA